MGDINLPLQHDLSLKRLCLTVLITNIYKDKAIKNRLQNKILTKYKNRFSFPCKTLKNEIIKLASDRVKKLAMPNNLISEALYMVVVFGKKIISWAEYVIRLLSLDMSYVDEIYWTYFGTIDDAKVYNAYMRKHGNFKKILKNDAKNYAFASKMACIYGNEKAILYHQDAMIKEVQKFLRGVKLPNIKNKVDQLAATYICFLYGESYDMMKEKTVFKKFLQTGKVSISDAIFICEDAKAVKFLWKFLTDSEKEKVKVELARANLYSGLFSCSMDSITSGDDDNAESEMFELCAVADIVLFLINQMTSEQKNDFLEEHASALLQLLSQVWPYQEICLKLLDEQLVREIISQDGEELLNTLLPCMARNSADTAVVPEAGLHENVFHKLLGKVFSIVTKGTKKQVLFDEFYYSCQGWDFPDAINKFYKVFDVNSLSIIINDKDLKRKRDLMISMGSWKISELIEKGELQMIVWFLEKVLINKDERKKFIRNWNLENHPVAADHPDILEKISTWLKA